MRNKTFLADSMRVTGRQLLMIAPIFLLVFAYSFLVGEPTSISQFEWALQAEHYQFVTGGRWWFFAGFVTLLAGSFYSFYRSDQTRNPQDKQN
ncbi:MAG: hypothetical protein FD131_3301 [Rhodocyclaceae bacterium]|nr:MAG: hypothetical protein FD131_3301 [Rhodocyclaceae bacterium]